MSEAMSSYEYKKKYSYFSGKKKDWIPWEEKYLAKSRRYGYKDLLLGKLAIPKSSDILDPDEDEDKLKIRVLNEDAYSDLVMSIDTTTSAGKVAFSLVRGTKSADYEDGNAEIAFARLTNKYAPKTAPSLAKTNRLFYQAKLKKQVDPDIFITYLEGLRATMGDMESFITDKQFIMHVMNNLNRDYDNTVENLEKQINDKNDPLTIEQMREDLSLKHERLYGTDDAGEFESDDDGEHALYAGAGRWKGKCNKCGKQGHKAVDCRSNSQSGKGRTGNGGGGNGGKRFEGKCHYCQKTGHRASDCFKKKRDQGGEQANAAKGKTAEKEEIADVVLTVIDEEEANYLKSELCTEVVNAEHINYSVYTNAKNIECLTCEDCKKYLVKGWCGKELCSTQVVGSNDDDSESSDELSSMPPLQVRKGRRWADQEDDSDDDDTECEDTPAQDIALVMDNSIGRAITDNSIDEMIDYLRLVAIKKGIREPNVDSWASSVEDKLSEIDIKTTRDVVANIITINGSLRDHGRSMFHNKTLDVLARVGVDIICPQDVEQVATALTVFEIPSDSDDDSEDYGEAGFFDDWSSSDDWTEDREESDNNDDNHEESIEYCFMSQTKTSNYKMNANTWLGDSAASTHMGFSDEGMTDVELINSPVRIGNGKALTATKIGKRRITIIQKDGSSQDAILEEYKCVPELWVNLFSISKSLQNGWNISNKGVEIKLSKGQANIVFDRIIKTSKGLVVGVEIVPRTDAMANVMLDRGKTIDINVLHSVLGHPSEEITKQTAQYYGWKITGTFKPCSNCQTAKSKQNSVMKETGTKSTIPGERIFIDTSSVRTKSFGGSKFWLLVVDDCTDVAWSAFLRKKSDQVDRIVDLIKDLAKKHKTTVKYIRCDNAGENGSLEKECAKQGLGIQFEYTGPGTPQFNGRVERKFATLYSKVRAMLNGAKLPTVKRKGLWTEAARTATDLENILVSTRKPVASYNAFFEKELPGLRNMRTFGEVAIVNDHKKRKMRGKLDDRGRPCIVLGRAENHNRDVYRFLNLETDRIIRSRDALWLNQQYGDWKGITQQDVTTIDDDDDDKPFLDISTDDTKDEETDNGREPEEVDRIEVVDENDTPVTPKLASALRKLGGFFTPEPQAITDRVGATTRSATIPAEDPTDQSGREDTLNVLIDRFDEDSDTVPDFAFLVAEVEKELTPEQKKTGAMKSTYDKLLPAEYKYVFDVPATFREAWDHPDPWQREKWRAAIRAEFEKMNKNKVWRKVNRSTMPSGRRCVKHKWVFDIKREGTFKARLVACGYSQIPGVDFTDVYSPVVHDVTFRIMLVAELKWKLKSKIVDVESAFLNGELEEEIYMECPDGLEHEAEECLLLLKAIYGLV